MPILHPYCRVSTMRQVDDGLSLDVQKQRISQHWEMYYQDSHTLSGHWVDKAESATRDFRSRPAGGRLHLAVNEGDIVAVYRLDRAFRNLMNCLNVLENWINRGVTLISLHEQINLGTAYGRLLVQIMGAFNEFDSALKSERIKDANQRILESGEPLIISLAGTYGYRFYGERGNVKTKMIPSERLQLGMFLTWRDQGFAWEEIYFHTLKLGLAPQPKGRGKGNEWGVNSIFIATMVECKLRFFEKHHMPITAHEFTGWNEVRGDRHLIERHLGFYMRWHDDGEPILPAPQALMPPGPGRAAPLNGGSQAPSEPTDPGSDPSTGGNPSDSPASDDDAPSSPSPGGG